MASTITQGSVNVPVGDRQVWSYLAHPIGEGPWPGILVIQEWWGLEPHMFDVAQRFAREGYVALMPDLFHGNVTNDATEAMEFLRSGFNQAEAVEELVASVQYLKGMSTCSGKVGVIGYCLGGGLALRTAIASDEVGAVNPYYGGNPDPIELVERIQCPVLGLYAERDEANRPSVPALEEALQLYNKQYECIVYPDAPHAFFNDTRDSYRPEAAADAWHRTMEFMGRNLG